MSSVSHCAHPGIERIGVSKPDIKMKMTKKKYMVNAACRVLLL